jgi:hypothetical protein
MIPEQGAATPTSTCGVPATFPDERHRPENFSGRCR